MTDEQRKIRALTKHLHELTNFVMAYLSEMDKVMKEPGIGVKQLAAPAVRKGKVRR